MLFAPLLKEAVVRPLLKDAVVRPLLKEAVVCHLLKEAVVRPLLRKKLSYRLNLTICSSVTSYSFRELEKLIVKHIQSTHFGEI